MADASLSVELRQDGPIPLDVSFGCGPRDVLAIFGPSGSGKTTILRAIAGLYRPTEGRVSLGDETWTDTARRIHLPTRDRRVGMVFQDYALFPHKTARGNVAAALGHRPAGERTREADRWLAAVHLDSRAGRRPDRLSGGERQRVALARALAREPRVLLLDEPFAAIDPSTRARLHDELDLLRARVGVPIVLVTHDLHDVVRLSTHVVLLESGRVTAAGDLQTVTSRTDIAWPRWLADFGSVIEATVTAIDPSRGLAELGFGPVAIVVPAGALTAGARVRVRIPARDVILATRRPEGLSVHNVLAGVVSGIGPEAGDHALVQMTIGETRLLADVTRDAVARLALAPGVAVFALIKSVSVEVFGPRADLC